MLYLTHTATNSRLVGEIGFNVGLSSHALLTAHPDLHVISFDLGQCAATKAAKKLIDQRFPRRHTLISGDSRTTVPAFKARYPALRFDLVFIDGGHDYEVAKADIINMKPLCTQKTLVIMDDLTPWLVHGVGPTRAWTEAIQEGVIHQRELFKDGKPAAMIKPPGKRSWALGHYAP
jgi:predicted O-methyltransferase YrrM